MNVPQATANPVILVTVATRDIGLAAARMLVDRGATVIIGSRDESRARQAAAKPGGRAEALQIDITQQLAAGLPDAMINSICPGWCRTDMGGPQAPLSPEQGTDTLVWLALDAPPDLRATFVKVRKVIRW
ncbi:MAG: SDR family NAD(P)-dependent oxidoreductase [Luteolibacter sp.]